MHVENVTTPFGRRPAKLSLVRRQFETGAMQARTTANKWQVYRNVCEARTLLGVQDRALAVLNALLSFHPETELGEGGLVVFPSNIQLSVRAHGISGATLRRALAALVEAGLIERRDSPNGKRYAHRDRAGGIEEAFGFSLAPLLSRSAEFAQLAEQVADEARRFRKAREALTICRRDVRKLISAAIEEGADGDWATLEHSYAALVERLPRNPRQIELESVLHDMALLRAEVLKSLELSTKTQKLSANDDHNERHIQNSNTESNFESKPLSDKCKAASTEPLLQPEQARTRIISLETVKQACPEISDYATAGAITTWSDLQAAASVVRSILGISPSAWLEACDVMGHENAAVTIACILQRNNHISSAGGYLRELTSRARRAEYSPGPALMALLRPNLRSSSWTPRSELHRHVEC